MADGHVNTNASQTNGTNGNVAVNANTSVLVLPAPTTIHPRLQTWIYNACSATAYINFGTTAVTGTGIPLAQGASITFTTYGGAISAISSGTGTIIYAWV
jgi:hypothetical protein